MNNLFLRILTGIVFVSSILISIWYSTSIFAAVMGLYLFGALWEYNRFFKGHSLISIPSTLFLSVCITIYVLFAGICSGLLDGPIGAMIIPLIFGYILVELWRKKENPLLNLSVAIFGIIYLVIPFLLILLIAQFNYKGNPLIIGMFLLIWTNDSFAYLTGRLIGKNPLFERISPKKTWEGTVGGIIFTIGASILIAHFMDDRQQYLFWIVSALIVAPCSILGDLLESLIKRSLKIKDSGSILPGHGGILDRFDATLFTAPFFFSWCLIYSYFYTNF